jgi:hypothetical protein
MVCVQGQHAFQDLLVALKRSATIPVCTENLNPGKVVMKPNKNRVRFCRNLAHDARQCDAEEVLPKICLLVGRDERKDRTMTRAKTKILFDGGTHLPRGRQLRELRRLFRGMYPLWVKSGHMRRNKSCRFTPNSDRGSAFPQTVMPALPPKADMCGATSDVR